MSSVDGANVKKTIYLSLGRIDFCTKMVSFLQDSRDYDAMDTSCASSTLLNSSHSSISTESSGSYGWATNSLFEIGNGGMAMADNIDIWKSTKPHKANDAAWEAIRTLRCKDGSVGLKHFKLVRRLGSGDIGNVYLCQLRNFGNCMFAMKVVDKEALAYRDKLHRAEIEKQILSMLDHPFLPTLYAHFDASHYSCVVMEFCPGGDLHSLRHRQRGKRFSLRSARFYAAEVLLALEYLHMMGVIFRDLKPENVLVRADGHIMLSDFDLSLRCDVVPTVIQKPASVVSTPATRRLSGSRRVSAPSGSSPAMEPPAVNCIPSWLFASSSKKKSGGANLMAGRVQVPELVAEPTLEVRSRSFVGTHEYLAPEVTSGEGHGSAVDWWTFGVFLFELLYGKTPFKGSNNEKTLLNIVTQPLKFPVNSNRDVGEAWDAARDLITRLLAKDPKARLGSNTGSADIKSHPFFNGVNWALIRSTVPPEIPGLRRTKTCYERKRVPQSVPSHFDYF